jgi:S1-C subfamily serine protease
VAPTTADSQQSTWRLKPLQIAGLHENVPITAEGITLGRSEHCSLRIPEGSYPYVSSSHARVWLLDGEPLVEDLGSKNGTQLNGRSIQRSRIANGDVIQLGSLGPRFAVVSGEVDQDTLPTMALPTGNGRPTRELTQTTLFRIKTALGIPSDADVSTLIRQRGRRLAWLAWGSVVIAVVVAVLWFIGENARSADEELRARLATEAVAIEEQRQAWELERRRFEQQQNAWIEEKSRLEEESRVLQERLQRLEQGAGASSTELHQLRQHLADARSQLELYDPVNVEQARLRDVRRITKAVVFIETEMRFRHRKSGELLHAEEADEDTLRLNVDGSGDVYTLESSGSGLCISGGWIVTNAHVVKPDADLGPMARYSDTFAAEVLLDVIFSGTAERHAAELVKAVLDGDVDVALLRIAPFEGMPALDGLDLSVPVPEPPAEVYLAGFPLGRMAVQQGEVVTASTFKGILSRVVGPFFQVDAAVHPGNSGGPVMDNHGHILGIATRVQRTPSGEYEPTIGYVTPIGVLQHVWPPETLADTPAAESGQPR